MADSGKRLTPAELREMGLTLTDCYQIMTLVAWESPWFPESLIAGLPYPQLVVDRLWAMDWAEHLGWTIALADVEHWMAWRVERHLRWSTGRPIGGWTYYELP